MLTHLYIENYTIIEKLDLEFQAGMTVLTGETGAGKSIIIDALDLVLGGRSDSKTIRTGKERCDIIAGFDISANPAAQQWLQTNEFEPLAECQLRRIIALDGRSRCYLNNKPVTLQSQREIGILLVNIHGQHEHQLLLKRDAQRNQLDVFANHVKLLEAVALVYTQWDYTRNQLTALTHQNQQHTAKADLLRYQIQELDDLALAQGELDQLEKQHKQLANAENTISQYKLIIDELADDDNANVLQLLHNTEHILKTLHIDTTQTSNSHQLILGAIVQIQEAVAEIRHCFDKIEIDPISLQEIEQRLQKIYDIARKHRVKPENLYAHHQNLLFELDQYAMNETQLEDLTHKITKLQQDYLNAAVKLAQSRQKAAQRFSQQITKSMQQLGMPGGKFAIEFSPYEAEQFSVKGLERIEFFVSTNPGQTLQALNKVVSGGELSRLSLAIQVISAQKDLTPTLIFDEVDVGIGGSTAAIVGQLLKQLGKKNQLLCITHLPQVAACGNQHYQVKKYTDKGLTYTTIQKLTQTEKVQEIARMLGGLKITPQTLAHAQEMLEII